MEYIKLPKLEKITVENPNEIPDSCRFHKVSSLWNKSKFGEGIRIAVIDTGADITHPDLQGQIESVRNFTTDDNSNPNIVTDYIGHGTHVSGIIGANQNGTGIMGIAPKSKLLILKALSKNGGQYPWIVNAVNYAIEQKVDIINMSLGGKYNDPNLHEAIKRAVNNGILVVCAAGNDGDGNSDTIEKNYPACYPEVISVGAVSLSNNVCSFSVSNDEVDLVAYGDNVVSLANNGQYCRMSGTSMASPIVAGILALLIKSTEYDFKRRLSETEIYSQLIKLTIPLGYPKNVEGNGLVRCDAPELLQNLYSNTQLLKQLQQ